MRMAPRELSRFTRLNGHDSHKSGNMLIFVVLLKTGIMVGCCLPSIHDTACPA
jgi:hypothetical protein